MKFISANITIFLLVFLMVYASLLYDNVCLASSVSIKSFCIS